MEKTEILPFPKAVADQLRQLAQEHEIDLEGYLLWLAEKQGPLLLDRKALKDSNVQLYKQDCLQELQALPRHILNAGSLYSQLTSSELGMEDALKHLENMSMPVAIFLLFAAEGYELQKYLTKAKAYAKMYPSVVTALPEPYNAIGKALINDPTG